MTQDRPKKCKSDLLSNYHLTTHNLSKLEKCIFMHPKRIPLFRWSFTRACVFPKQNVFGTELFHDWFHWFVVVVTRWDISSLTCSGVWSLPCSHPCEPSPCLKCVMAIAPRLLQQQLPRDTNHRWRCLGPPSREGGYHSHSLGSTGSPTGAYKVTIGTCMRVYYRPLQDM